MKELKEVTQNSNMSVGKSRDKDLSKIAEKTSSKKKYDYKPHYSSMVKNTLKENSFSASKLILQSRKPSQPFM